MRIVWHVPIPPWVYARQYVKVAFVLRVTTYRLTLLCFVVVVGPGSSCAGVISGEEDLGLLFAWGASALLVVCDCLCVGSRCRWTICSMYSVPVMRVLGSNASASAIHFADQSWVSCCSQVYLWMRLSVPFLLLSCLWASSSNSAMYLRCVWWYRDLTVAISLTHFCCCCLSCRCDCDSNADGNGAAAAISSWCACCNTSLMALSLSSSCAFDKKYQIITLLMSCAMQYVCNPKFLLSSMHQCFVLLLQHLGPPIFYMWRYDFNLHLALTYIKLLDCLWWCTCLLWCLLCATIRRCNALLSATL